MPKETFNGRAVQRTTTRHREVNAPHPTARIRTRMDCCSRCVALIPMHTLIPGDELHIVSGHRCAHPNHGD